VVSLRITGQFDRLKAFQRQLETAPRLARMLNQNLAEESLTLVADGYRSARDPYGAKWTPRKSRGGGRALLVKTGAMRNSAHATSVTARGFALAFAMAYWIFHQRGTRNMVRRLLLPLAGRLPSSWAAAYGEVYDEIMTEHFR
jgi:hypothetical protein